MRRALLAFVGVLGLYGCYDYTLPPADGDGDPKNAPSGQTSESGPLNPTSVDEANQTSGSTSSSTSTTGDPPGATSSDAGRDASTATTSIDGCAANGNFCGGPNALLKCNTDGTKTYLGRCANGCVDGACTAATKCVAGGTYCGGDKVNGDPNVLYKCGADGFATTVQQPCTNGCTVAPAGSDDYCN